MKYEEVEVNSERWFDLTPLLNEEFRDIESLDNNFKVSNYGRVMNAKTNKILKCHESKIDKYQKGRKSTHNNYYLRTRICNTQKNRNCLKYNHRLVAECFLDNYSEELEVNHKNYKKYDNRIDNLEMVTASENTIHSYKNVNRGKRKRAVLQMDINKRVIREFDSIIEVEKQLGFLSSVISNACRLGYFSYNYYWKYKEVNHGK